MSEISLKWVCPICKRGFKREAYYLRHTSRATCSSERDSILAGPSQPASPHIVSRDSNIQEELLLWFDNQIASLRESFIQQLRMLNEEETSSSNSD